MRTPTTQDREAWITDRHEEITAGLEGLDEDEQRWYFEQATDDIDNKMGYEAEQERDDKWYRDSLKGGE